jgi:hypothetical protein
MMPPVLGENQVNCGPDWADERAPDGRVLSLKTPVGNYDLAAVASALPHSQAPDLAVCLVDASWRNMPRNLGALRCPAVLLVADTHHLGSPLIGMLRYASAEKFARIVLLYDRHHAAFFHAAGLRNLFWFPGLTFPHDDAAVHRSRAPGPRVPRIAFVGQSGRHHPRRARLLGELGAAGLPVDQRALGQAAGLDFYGSSLVGFNASLNGDLNLRVFEILASGGTLLTDRLAPDSGMAALLGEGRQAITYGSPVELRKRAQAAIADPEGTRAIGAAGALWFDRHLSMSHRREAFRSLALDGIPVPEFEFSEAERTRVFLGGDTGRLLQGLLAYEDIQEVHRTQETVHVLRSAGSPPDVDALFATLPRVASVQPGGATLPDLSIFSRSEETIVPADRLWCADARESDSVELAARFRAHGYVPMEHATAIFQKAPASRPAPAPKRNSRAEGLLLVCRVALEAGDYALCRETLPAAARAGAEPGKLRHIAAAAERAGPAEAAPSLACA